MLRFPRSQAKLLRAVLRYFLLDQEPRGEWPWLLFRSGPKGELIQAQKGNLALCWQQPTPGPEITLIFRSTLLADLEGSARAEPVSLQLLASGNGRATWTERGAPRVVDFATKEPEEWPEFPGPPQRYVTMPPHFLLALNAACQTTSRDQDRFAVVQLCATKRELIATDGRQLLVQGGFDFPWKEDLLIPRTQVFGKQNLLPEGPLGLGRTDSHVCLRLGSWTLLFGINQQLRYPSVRTVVPSFSTHTCHLQVDEADAHFLLEMLPRLPGGQDQHAPVTLDLEGRPRIRAQADESDTITEAELSRSRVEGTPMMVLTDRHFLHRAMQLGFRTLDLVKPDAPATCRDGHRIYVWSLLSNKDAVAAAPEMIRIVSTHSQPPTPRAETRPQERREPVMPVPRVPPPNSDNNNPDPRTQGHGPQQPGPQSNGRSAPSAGIEDLISEAEQIRTLLQEAGGRLARLTAALKHFKRQSKALEQAVSSLKHLNFSG